MGKSVLVVEDEQKIRDWVATYFKQAGFDVWTAQTGPDGLREAQTHRPDLLILDLNLPGMDGLDVCRAIRRDTDSTIADVPIIMLTARVEEADRLIGLELGADDYVTKPFSPKELVARAKAIFRRMERMQQPEATVLRDGDLLVDVNAHTVTLAQQPIHLTPNEFKLLVTLMQNRGHALSRAQLIGLAFGHDYDGLERSVDVYIRQLRDKLEDNPREPQRLLTVFGVGYRYAP